MRKIFGLMLGLSLATPAWADESLWKEWTSAAPRQRLAVHQLLWESYPDLAGTLYADLKQHYPQLELKAFKAWLTFRQGHGGLAPQIARSLLQDLGDEPAQAALDVATAVLARYPDFPQRFQQLRQATRPEPPAAAAGFRTAVLEGLTQAPAAPWGDVLKGVRAKHRGLGVKLWLDLSRLLDSRPELAAEVGAARAEEQRPVFWMAQHHPEFLLEAARKLHDAHGAELREVALEVLGELEKAQQGRTPVLAQTVYGLLESRYPKLAEEVVQQRLKTRQELGRQVREAFPELPEIVARTLQDKHPQLLGRAAQSLDQHHPGLRQELLSALEVELPGLHQEVQSFLTARYPDLKPQVESLLKGG